MDNTFASVLTGDDCWGTNPIKESVAKRAAKILPNVEQKHPQGWDACYDGNRCEPQNLGWRFQQIFGGPEDPQEILDGKWDEQIVATYHEAASAEHYYRYEKDWGE